MAAITLALLFVCVFLVINKQAQLSVITNEVQTYMGQRDTLRKEVGDLQGHRDRRVALDKEWEEFKTKEGELIGKYGEKKALEGECTKLTEKCDGLRRSVKAHEELVSSLERRIAELASQTNFLGKTMNRMRGERDAILADTKADMETQDKVKALRVAEEARYTEQKRLADQESERAYSEKKRADEAKIAADDAERRKEDAERAAKAAESAQKSRVTALRAETDKEVAEHEKLRLAAIKAAAYANASVEAEKLKLKTLAEEIARLETRRNELVSVKKQLAETKVALSIELKKLDQAMKRVTAQQVVTQIDGVREEMVKRLGEFKVKLEELEKKQNEEVK
jgi:hypothetical protein